MLAWDNKRLIFEQLLAYSQAIHNLVGGSSFWDFIVGTLNATCRPVVDQQEFYFGHKQKHGYKYQSIVTTDGLVSSLMGLFIGRHGDWKIVELFELESKLREIYTRRLPAQGFYLYGSPVYCTVYGIMGLYKNYPSTQPRTLVEDQFNKILAKLCIKVEYDFAIHQNLWTWNAFHLGLKIFQKAAITYAVSVFLANIWTRLRGNQTSLQFACSPLALEDYLQVLDKEAESSSESD